MIVVWQVYEQRAKEGRPCSRVRASMHAQQPGALPSLHVIIRVCAVSVFGGGDCLQGVGEDAMGGGKGSVTGGEKDSACMW